MSDFIISSTDGGPKELPPGGPQNAVCVFVEDVGNEWSEMYGKLTHKLVMCFELEEKMADGRPFMLSQTYTVSLSEKANLRHDLEAWRGKPFSVEELAGFNIRRLIGIGVTLNVMVAPNKKGQMRAKIAGLMPKMKNAPALAIHNTEQPKWIEARRMENAAAEASRKRVDAAADAVEGFDGSEEVESFSDGTKPPF